MENVDNIIIEHLRNMRGKIDQIGDDVREMKHRLNNVEATQGTILQHLGHLATSIAQQQLSFDRMTERVEMIEKRLDIASAQ
jgi:phage shock protein A